MSLIVYQVAQAWDRWAVLHHDQPLATFDSREEAERAALALATHHPKSATAEVDLPHEGLGQSAIRVF